ncbi:MAG: hypothetical protein IKT82_02050 [Bacteroidaceae bacterium]|nr:hypothetical protein [Bacteroidaceae bacterium]
MLQIKRFIILALLTFASILGLQAQKAVYGFAYSTCLKDSVVYLSAIQQIPEAQIGKQGFLNYRADFGTQFSRYIQQYYDQPNATTVVFFHKNRKKLEKRFLKVRKTTKQEQGKRIVEVNYSDFKFTPIAE